MSADEPGGRYSSFIREIEMEAAKHQLSDKARSPEEARSQEIMDQRAALWRDKFGEDVARSPEAIAADQRTLAKALPPEHERRELGENWQRAEWAEQNRQVKQEREGRQVSGEKELSDAERWAQGTRPENRGMATMEIPAPGRERDRNH
jgi:hypothetical protein